MTGTEKNHSKELDEDKDEDVEIRRRAIIAQLKAIQRVLEKI